MLNHTLTACMEFNRDVTFESALKVLAPLIDLFGWTGEQFLQREPLGREDFIEPECDGEFIRKLTIYTTGAVQSQLWQLNLAPMSDTDRLIGVTLIDCINNPGAG